MNSCRGGVLSPRRVYLLISLFFGVFLALSGRLFYYQILKGRDIARAAVAMRSHKVELREYCRGDILDRNLTPLTDTHVSAAVYCLPALLARAANIDGSDPEVQEKLWQETAEFMARVLKDKEQREILAKIKNAASYSAYVMLDDQLSSEEIQQIESAHRTGLVVAPLIKRYQEDGFCAHLLGYVGKDIDGDGKSGIEKTYNDILQGNGPSTELVSIFDARGQPIQGLAGKLKIEPLREGSVVLTIDKRIQKVVEQALDERVIKGAAVVMDIHSKEILAMASRPTFNPYQVSDVIAFDNRSTLNNRALNKYNPGSLFKILLSTAALEEGITSIDEQFNCSGKYVFNDQVTINCWKEDGHGILTFAQAFANSCNPTFIKIGLRLGRDKILAYVNKLHLTDETIIGYDPGPMGTYVEIDGGEPALGNASLGQKGVMISPLEVASLLCTVADDGVWAAPSLVQYTVDRNGNKQILSRGGQEQAISPAAAEQVRQLLVKVVEDGTGKSAAIPETQVAGKTATCQTGRMNDDNEEILNTWFAGYLPAQEPRWAIVVLSEEGTSGAQNCAPVFRDISRGILQFY